MNNTLKNPVTGVDYSGQRFGRLVVLEFAGYNKYRHKLWKCICDCGKISTVRQEGLTHRSTLSCGCLRRENLESGSLSRTHGESGGRLYNIWVKMKQRCNNPKSIDWVYYGGKGITVCDAWAESYVAFRSWALSSGYSDDLTIERINNNGMYEPGNCTWIPHRDQGKNTSRVKRITINGKTHNVTEWAKILGVSLGKIYNRSAKQGITIEQSIRSCMRLNP